MKPKKEKFETLKINIWLNQENKNKLIEIKQKYKVSFSTITEKCLIVLAGWKDKFSKEYLFKQENATQTKIKPRKHEIDYITSITCTNSLLMFIQKDFSKIAESTEQDIKQYNNKIYNMIIRELQICKDQFYDYHNQIKNYYRAARENKKYLRDMLHDNQQKDIKQIERDLKNEYGDVINQK